jgi:hypothetical protein
MLRFGAGRDPEEMLREVAGGELAQESFADSHALMTDYRDPILHNLT